MALTNNERYLIEQLELERRRTRKADLLNLRYYQGRQRVEQLGMAIPPAMRRFLVVTNWPRVVVDTTVSRQQLRALMLPGEETSDPILRAILDANNMSAQLPMFNRDRSIYARAFMSVSANEDHEEHPFMRVESPRSMVALIDPSPPESMIAAGRFYSSRANTSGLPTNLTLMLPDATVACVRDKNGRWEEAGDRDAHFFGRVPVVMHVNRRLSGEFVGETEIADIIGVTDAAARSLTNLQFAQEAHGIPRMFMTGVAQGDFIDADGNPIPQFEAYFDAIHFVKNPNGKVGQLEAADLKNFETALQIYGKQASIITGFPASYFGLTTTNPSSADAIRADETRLVRSVEDQNGEVGVTLGWAGALAYEFATGTEVVGNQVQADWFDPATPTVAQREDALSKRRAAGALSREGYWDELGWSEARKAKERKYLADERAEALNDPDLDLARVLVGGSA